MSVLSKKDILRHMKGDNIVISPFEIGNLGNTSYDVRLGKYYYRQQPLSKQTQVFNPFYEKSLRRMYNSYEIAVPVKDVKSTINPYHNLKNNDLVILISPNETILGHTIEFIGGKNGTKDLPAVTSAMRARSSIGRIGVTVCKCAGWGDIGYVNRWTMEISNDSSSTVALPIGLRIAQIIFYESSAVEKEDRYADKGGKYQSKSSLEALKKAWKPENMLPKLYMDKDLGHFSEYNNH